LLSDARGEDRGHSDDADAQNEDREQKLDQ
jgi:hypothetical protein